MFNLIFKHSFKIYVNKSELYPNVGEGVFARKTIEPYTIVAFFGGRVVSVDQWNTLNLYEPNYWRIFDDNQVRQRTLTIGGSITGWRISCFTGLDLTKLTKLMLIQH